MVAVFCCGVASGFLLLVSLLVSAGLAAEANMPLPSRRKPHRSQQTPIQFRSDAVCHEFKWLPMFPSAGEECLARCLDEMLFFEISRP